MTASELHLHTFNTPCLLLLAVNTGCGFDNVVFSFLFETNVTLDTLQREVITENDVRRVIKVASS